MYLIYIFSRYKKIKNMSKSDRQEVVPRVFFLGGKAAPGYHIAK
jgi:glucan phosphorylase